MLGFVENGGYALAAYDRFRKLFRDSEGARARASPTASRASTA